MIQHLRKTQHEIDQERAQQTPIGLFTAQDKKYYSVIHWISQSSESVFIRIAVTIVATIGSGIVLSTQIATPTSTSIIPMTVSAIEVLIQ
jgi:hypothetical protein